MIDYRAPSCTSTTAPLRILLGHLSMWIPGFSRFRGFWGPETEDKKGQTGTDESRAEKHPWNPPCLPALDCGEACHLVEDH